MNRHAEQGHSPVLGLSHLKGMYFPGGKEALMQFAQQNRAPEEVLDAIEQLPDREFRNIEDVLKVYRLKGSGTPQQEMPSPFRRYAY